MKCLLIKTKDKKFLTYQKNYKHLLEYSKNFKAKMYVAKTKSKDQILELNSLVVALCDKNYKSEDLEYEIIEEKK